MNLSQRNKLLKLLKNLKLMAWSVSMDKIAINPLLKLLELIDFLHFHIPIFKIFTNK